jgi:hypothetical protein
MILNGVHKVATALNSLGILINLFVFILITSFINYLNAQCIKPFLNKIFNFPKNNIFKELSSELFINIAGIATLFFLFFAIPLSLYYIFSLCKLLLENLSIQMNILVIGTT